MCNRTSHKKLMIKILAILSLFCLAEGASGACMTYGHACWGAHGKRSENLNLPQKDDHGKNSQSKWFLSRLIPIPSDLRILRGGSEDFDMPSQQNLEGIFSLDDVDIVNRRQEQFHDNHDLMTQGEDQLFDENFSRSDENNRMRLPKLLDKRSAKQN